MSKIALSGNASGTGTLTIAAPNTNSDRTLTLPDNSGTVLTSASNLAGVTGVGKVLQVVQVVKTDTFSTTSTSFTDVTGLSASITPSSATSKILVISYAVLGNSNTSANYYAQARILRDSTAIFVGNAAGSRSPSAFGAVLPNSADTQAATPIFLDSPATTSSVTYKLQILSESGGTATIGRMGSDSDAANFGRYPASITLMEIAA